MPIRARKFEVIWEIRAQWTASSDDELNSLILARRCRSGAVHLITVVDPQVRVASRNPTLPRITAVAADRPAAARLLAVTAAGRSAACYTTCRDTTPSPRLECGLISTLVGIERLNGTARNLQGTGTRFDESTECLKVGATSCAVPAT